MNAFKILLLLLLCTALPLIGLAHVPLPGPAFPDNTAWTLTSDTTYQVVSDCSPTELIIQSGVQVSFSSNHTVTVWDVVRIEGNVEVDFEFGTLIAESNCIVSIGALNLKTDFIDCAHLIFYRCISVEIGNVEFDFCGDTTPFIVIDGGVDVYMTNCRFINPTFGSAVIEFTGDINNGLFTDNIIEYAVENGLLVHDIGGVLEITNNQINGSSAEPDYTGIRYTGETFENGRVNIMNNRISFFGTGISVEGAVQMDCPHSQMQIRNNVIRDATVGIAVISDNNPETPEHPKIYNNSIFNCTGDGIRLEIDYAEIVGPYEFYLPDVRNNTCWNINDNNSQTEAGNGFSIILMDENNWAAHWEAFVEYFRNNSVGLCETGVRLNRDPDPQNNNPARTMKHMGLKGNTVYNVKYPGGS